MARKRKSKLKKNKLDFLKYIKSSESIALISLFFVSAILFVLLRMKAVDMGIELAKHNKAYEAVLTQNKELKAHKAGLLSAGNLRKFARKHHLQEPKAKQIIVVE